MLRQSTFATILWLLAIALLPVRIANAHMHMCLDGQKPVVAYHVQDVPTHNGTDTAGDGHSDRDVDASGASATLNKLSDLDNNSLSLLAVYAIALLLPAPESEAPQASSSVVELTPAFDLRPPTRGPPL